MAYKNNGVYYIKESVSIFRHNGFSNFFTLLSNGLIFFMLALVIAGWFLTNEVVSQIENEAEVSVYTKEELVLDSPWLATLKAIPGINEVNFVSKEEAYARMVLILGEEAKVLQYFQDNPFTSFVEVGIDLNNIDTILEQLKNMDEVASLRDNRDILDKLREISKALNYLSYMILAAVGITTLVTLSHTIRQSIYHYREEIITLTLLGAPRLFVAIPFYLMGMLMTMIASLGAVAAARLLIQSGYDFMAGPLPFIPLPPIETVLNEMSMIVMMAGLVLGYIGCLLGMNSVSRR